MPGYESHHNDDAYRDPHGDGADIVQPLAYVEADDVQHRRGAQREEREGDVESRVGGEMFPVGLPDEEDVAGGEVEDGGEVGQVAGPVSPGGHKAGEVAEGALAPHVEAAFVGIAR